MKNFVADGNTVTTTAGSAISSGDVVALNDMVGIAQNDATSGASVVTAIVGVFSVAKVSAQTWAVGDKVNWDASASNFTTAATAAAGDVTAAGVCMEAAGSGVTICAVRLSPGSGTGS